MTAPTMTPGSEEQAPDSPRRRSPSALAGVVAGLRGMPGRIGGLRAQGLRRSPVIFGVIGALWAAGIGLAVAVLSLVLVWVATPDSGLSLSESLRIGGLLWSIAQGAPVTIGSVTYSLLPWGLAIVPLLLLGYAGGWSARRSSVSSPRDLLVLVGCGTVTYAVVAAVVAHVSTRPDSSVSLARTCLHAALLAVLAFGWGSWRVARRMVGDLLPWWLSVALRGGGIGAVCIVGFGAVAAAAALLVRVDDAITMTQSLHAGLWGGFGLFLLGLAYLPVAVVWGASYVIGAGFTVGPTVAISPFILVSAPTQLPPFPLLAAVPQSATPFAWALPVLGVVAGVVVGLAIVRSCRGETRLTRLALAVGSAAASGVIMFFVTMLGDGALGDVRLTHVGPSPSTVAVLAFVLVLLGAVPSAVAPRAPGRPDLTVAEPREAASTGDVDTDGDDDAGADVDILTNDDAPAFASDASEEPGQ